MTAVRRSALVALTATLLAATAGCGSPDSPDKKDGGALPGYPDSFHGADRLAQVRGDAGQTSFDLRFVPDGVTGPAFLTCTGAPAGAKVLMVPAGTKLGQWNAENTVPCTATPPAEPMTGSRNMPWHAVPTAVGRPAEFRVLLVRTRIDENIEAVVATPITDAPDVRIVAAAYSAAS